MESATVQLSNGKSTFHTTHVKPYNNEELVFAIEISIVDKKSANKVILFCHPTNNIHHNPEESSFEKSRLKKFSTLTENAVFAIAPCYEAGYRINSS